MSERPGSPDPSARLRVLLIDDSDVDAALVLGALHRAGYDPVWRRVCGAAALSEALAKPWDLILSDWNMPGFGGEQALAILRARQIDAPILIVSSELGEDGAVTAMKGGANDYVTKDRLTRLVPAIERALREAETARARRTAEAALRVSEERFGKAFEYAPHGMSMVGIDGTTLKVNRAMGQMLGYSEEDLRDLPVWRFTHPDDMPATIAQLQRLVEGEIDTWFLEKRFFHRDGRVIWGRSTTWLVRDPDGKAQYVVSQVQDITEWKRLQEETQRQRSELAQALRVASMVETVAQVAHELNQPLASIANFANGLIARVERGRAEPDAIRAVAEQIAGEALRAGESIRRVRALLSSGEAKFERCDANDVIRDAIRLVEPDLSAHAIRLDLELSAQPLPVEVNRVQVEQVLVHLLHNAVEALAAQSQGARDLAVDSELRGDRVIAVRVRDSGVGLPASVGTEIFDPFFTTKDDALGLGLAISRSIVHAHGGELWALSNQDRGATVGFTLPAA